PRRGAAMAVCEAARNVSCAGDRPLGVTNCMNFGTPERPEILWQFAEAIEGIAEACRALEVPVVGGNVSFYNETVQAKGATSPWDSSGGTAILPTPIIGVVGVLEDASRLGTQWFKAAGQRIALVGPAAGGGGHGGAGAAAGVRGADGGVGDPVAVDRDDRRRAVDRARIGESGGGRCRGSHRTRVEERL